MEDGPRKYRLELILLGYALGSQQARESIKGVVKLDDVSRTNREPFDAIFDEDREWLFEWLSSIDVPADGETVLESILMRWERYSEKIKAAVLSKKIVDDLSASEPESVESIRSRLELAFEMAKKMEKP